MIMRGRCPQRSAVRMKPLPRRRSAWTVWAASPRDRAGAESRGRRGCRRARSARAAAVVGTNASATAGAWRARRGEERLGGDLEPDEDEDRGHRGLRQQADQERDDARHRRRGRSRGPVASV